MEESEQTPMCAELHEPRVDIVERGVHQHRQQLEQQQQQQQPPLLECPLCEAVFSERSLIVSHINWHYPQDSRLCPVLTCRQMFNHPNSVRNHMRQKHLVQWNLMKQLKSQNYLF